MSGIGTCNMAYLPLLGELLNHVLNIECVCECANLFGWVQRSFWVGTTSPNRYCWIYAMISELCQSNKLTKWKPFLCTSKSWERDVLIPHMVHGRHVWMPKTPNAQRIINYIMINTCVCTGVADYLCTGITLHYNFFSQWRCSETRP